MIKIQKDNRNKFLIFLFTLIAFVIFVVPAMSSAAGLVPCDNVATPCNFKAFMTLINTIIRFILFDLALPIAAIMFAYAGFLMVTSGGSTESRSKAKKIFTNTALGLIIAVGAWLIISSILSILGYKGAWIGF